MEWKISKKAGRPVRESLAHADKVHVFIRTLPDPWAANHVRMKDASQATGLDRHQIRRALKLLQKQGLVSLNVATFSFAKNGRKMIQSKMFVSYLGGR